MDFSKEIITARICPYCGKKPEYVDSAVIYGRSYGMAYYCQDCDAYVGVHQGTSKKALGRLANKELREAKKKAHFYFDQLWRKAMKQGRTKGEARTSAYDWLSKELGTPREFTHIGMFDVTLCNEVVRVCEPYCLEKIYYDR